MAGNRPVLRSGIGSARVPNPPESVGAASDLGINPSQGAVAALESQPITNPVPSTYLQEINTPQGPVSVTYGQTRIGGATTLGPINIAKNITFSQPISQSSNGFNVTGSNVYTYQLQGNQLVASPVSTGGTINYQGVTVGNLTSSGVQATKNTVQLPIYATVSGYNQELGTETLSPTVTNGALSLQPTSFSGQAVEIGGKETYFVTPTFNAATGQITVTGTPPSGLAFPTIAAKSIAPTSPLTSQLLIAAATNLPIPKTFAITPTANPQITNLITGTTTTFSPAAPSLTPSLSGLLIAGATNTSIGPSIGVANQTAPIQSLPSSFTFAPTSASPFGYPAQGNQSLTSQTIGQPQAQPSQSTSLAQSLTTSYVQSILPQPSVIASSVNTTAGKTGSIFNTVYKDFTYPLGSAILSVPLSAFAAGNAFVLENPHFTLRQGLEATGNFFGQTLFASTPIGVAASLLQNQRAILTPSGFGKLVIQTAGSAILFGGISSGIEEINEPTYGTPTSYTVSIPKGTSAPVSVIFEGLIPEDILTANEKITDTIARTSTSQDITLVKTPITPGRLSSLFGAEPSEGLSLIVSQSKSYSFDLGGISTSEAGSTQTIYNLKQPTILSRLINQEPTTEGVTKESPNIVAVTKLNPSEQITYNPLIEGISPQITETGSKLPSLNTAETRIYEQVEPTTTKTSSVGLEQFTSNKESIFISPTAKQDVAYSIITNNNYGVAVKGSIIDINTGLPKLNYNTVTLFPGSDVPNEIEGVEIPDINNKGTGKDIVPVDNRFSVLTESQQSSFLEQINSRVVSQSAQSALVIKNLIDQGVINTPDQFNAIGLGNFGRTFADTTQIVNTKSGTVTIQKESESIGVSKSVQTQNEAPLVGKGSEQRYAWLNKNGQQTVSIGEPEGISQKALEQINSRTGSSNLFGSVGVKVITIPKIGQSIKLNLGSSILQKQPQKITQGSSQVSKLIQNLRIIQTPSQTILPTQKIITLQTPKVTQKTSQTQRSIQVQRQIQSPYPSTSFVIPTFSTGIGLPILQFPKLNQQRPVKKAQETKGVKFKYVSDLANSSLGFSSSAKSKKNIFSRIGLNRPQ